jgi:hypothetical protein
VNRTLAFWIVEIFIVLVFGCACEGWHLRFVHDLQYGQIEGPEL